MSIIKIVPLCAAIAITTGGVVLLGSPAHGKQRPVVVTAPALPDDDYPTRRVSYADLNLATMAGEKRLHRRVSGAVRVVCFESVPSGTVYEVDSCRRYAWRGAQPQIDRAVMRAREIASTGKSSIAATAITLTFPK